MSINNPESGTDSYFDVASAAEAIESFLPDEGEQEQADSDVTDLDAVQQSDDGEADAVEADEAELSDDELVDDELVAVEETPEPQAVKVKVDGQEIEVTLDELKSGYSRTQDYTKKTQEVANLRKEVEAERQAIVSERQAYAQILSQLEQQVSQTQEPDWDYLRSTDPIEYSLQWTEWQRGQQKRALIQQEQQRVAQLSQQEQMQSMAQQAEREKEALLAVLPQWKDPVKAKTEKSLIIAQGKKLGFSDDELKQVFDHRAVVALRKAALYDQMIEKRNQAKPVQQTKTAKAGNSQQPAVSQDKKQALTRLKQTGTVRDAAKAFESILFG